ncbi:MAG TPA: glycosyltransferase family 4 protein [Patescibacteria group bacterium]|nr:glycosyltransferase family 4 protein [Patescibacteria group bacterium]
MKIFIPFTIKDTGGTSTFAKKFGKKLEERGHEVFFDFRKDYDILFVIVQCNPLYLLHAKMNKRKIIQRLDGVYYWSVAQWKYPLLNFPPRFIHKFFSDFTVYQSKYSKYCADKFLGKRKNEQYSIIYNGVDTTLFSPEGEKIDDIRDNPEQKVFITASKFRRYDQIIPIIKALEIYRDKYNKNFKLLIIGDFSREVEKIPAQFKKFTYLNFIGKIKNEDLPKYERSSDVFLMTHLNPPCPNNIIEAMACGLPICGVNDGAMREITVPEENSLLLKSEGDAFWKMREYDVSQFADNLDSITKNLNFYSTNSRKIAEKKFSLDDMTARYLTFF